MKGYKVFLSLAVIIAASCMASSSVSARPAKEDQKFVAAPSIASAFVLKSYEPTVFDGQYQIIEIPGGSLYHLASVETVQKDKFSGVNPVANSPPALS